ncbi:MAG TPA: type IV secretory system conjugative DNA transfer family protein [Verrucomicrobiae bacterium]|nr:type IV secretory system conjugative DNA transfer family protein [Verrucomicrobiae bacterium]
MSPTLPTPKEHVIWAVRVAVVLAGMILIGYPASWLAGDPASVNPFAWPGHALSLVFTHTLPSPLGAPWGVGQSGAFACWYMGLCVAIVVGLFIQRPSLRGLVGRGGGADDVELRRWVVPWAPREVRERRGLPPYQLVLGITKDGRWRVGRGRNGALALGTTQSGKTTSILIPNALAWAGSLVTTSTKTDVLLATVARRQRLGRTYVLDLFGELPPEQTPPGLVRVRYTPPEGCEDWDVALDRCMAMTEGHSAGVTNGDHWGEKAGEYVAPLFHAAALSDRPLASTVVRWARSRDRETPARILAERGHPAALEMLRSFDSTPATELGSILSTATRAVSAYSMKSVLANERTGEQLDADAFTEGANTLYVLVPPRLAKRGAPIVLGLLDSMHGAVLRASANGPGGRLRVPMLWALDEIANITPIPNLDSLASESSGRGLILLVLTQHSAQLRAKWPEVIGRAMPALFPNQLLVGGLQDLDHGTELATLSGADLVAEWENAEPTERKPLPRHLRSGDRLTVQAMHGLKRGEVYVTGGGLVPRKLTAPLCWTVEPFKSWVSPVTGHLTAPADVTADEPEDDIGHEADDDAGPGAPDDDRPDETVALDPADVQLELPWHGSDGGPLPGTGDLVLPAPIVVEDESDVERVRQLDEPVVMVGDEAGQNGAARTRPEDELGLNPVTLPRRMPVPLYRHKPRGRLDTSGVNQLQPKLAPAPTPIVLATTLALAIGAPDKGGPAPMARTGRPNRHAGACSECGEGVPAGAGVLLGRGEKGWQVAHRVCRSKAA